MLQGVIADLVKRNFEANGISRINWRCILVVKPAGEETGRCKDSACLQVWPVLSRVQLLPFIAAQVCRLWWCSSMLSLRWRRYNARSEPNQWHSSFWYRKLLTDFPGRPHLWYYYRCVYKSEARKSIPFSMGELLKMSLRNTRYRAREQKNCYNSPDES